MQKRALSQETLKMIACMTMLVDHLAVIIVMGSLYSTHHGMRLEIYETMRLIGRIAFPIYCFLLAEGSAHTHNHARYGLRLAICALLSELPYDLALWGRITWQHQNVMVTLFLGFCALGAMKRCPNLPLKLLLALPFAALAEFAGGDYGAKGIMLVVLFALTRRIPHRHLAQVLGIWFVFSPNHAMFLNWMEQLSVTTQEWAVLAILPITLYDGRKVTKSKAVQWGFYLFYPVHLLALYLIARI